MPESFPTTFGRYTLIERLGIGGMAEVFLAEVAGPASFSKRVVVKRLLPELTGDREVVARFLAEARLSAKFAHPNVVQVFELGDVDGDYFIAMEHVSGADLRKIERLLWPTGTEVPIGIAATVAAAVCRGLDHVHGLSENGTPLGIVHRDVSPSNVLLSTEGGVKLIDFGVARAHAHARITRHGTAIMGKLVYASPEQVLGLSVTPRSDLFSAGCLLYEALTGVRPFERETEPATLHAITREAARPPSAIRAAVPAALDEVVMRSLARNPADRWPTAGQMAQALEAFVAERSQLIGTPQIAGFVRAALTVTRMGDAREREPQPAATPGRPRTLAPAAPARSPSPRAAPVPPPVAPPPGLEELPTIVDPGAGAVAAAAVPSTPLPPERPIVPSVLAPPPGLEELPTAVAPPERVEEALAAAAQTVTPSSGRRRDPTLLGFGVASALAKAPPGRPVYGVPEGMPGADTVTEGEGSETPLPPVPDLPSEATRIDPSAGEAAREDQAHKTAGTAVESPLGRRSGSLAALRVPDEDDWDDEPSTGSGVARLSPEAEARYRLGHASTMAIPAYTVQPDPDVPHPLEGAFSAAALVQTADASTAVPTLVHDRAGTAAPLLHASDASTAAPTLASGPSPLGTPPSARPIPPGPGQAAAPPARPWTLAAVAPPRRPIPVTFLAVAGAAAVVAAIVVIAILVGGSDDPPGQIAPLPPLPPRPPGATVASPSHASPGLPAPAPAPAPAPVPAPSPAPAPVPVPAPVPAPVPVPAPAPPPSTAPQPSAPETAAPSQPVSPQSPRKNRNVGRLRLTSTPRGAVEIDGVRVAASTPLIGHPLPPGLHRIRIVAERSQRSATISVRVRAGRVVSRHVRLRRNPRLR